MFDKERVLDFLKENLKEKRFNHVMGVVSTAKELAKIYNEDIKKAEIAALIHDCAKNFTFEKNLGILRRNNIELDEVSLLNKELIHSVVAPIIAKEEFAIEDEEILNAVRYHTTGRKNSSTFEKIIYLADAIEPSRSYKEIHNIREKAFGGNLDEAVLMSINNTIKFLISKGMLIHNDTIDMRNSILILGGDSDGK